MELIHRFGHKRETVDNVRYPQIVKKQAGRPEDAREKNMRIVFGEILRSSDALSRATISSRTGLTRATVSRLTDELLKHGFILEGPPETGPTRGRPSRPLQLNPSRYLAIGIEVAVSFAQVVAVDLKGKIVFSKNFALDPQLNLPEHTLPLIGDYIDDQCAAMGYDKSNIAGSCLAIHGLVESGTLRILHTPNLDWDETIPTRMLSSSYIPVLSRVVNEADAAAISSAFISPGVPNSLNDFIYLTGEVGVGGSIVMNNTVYHGENGWAGEIGHLIVNPNGPLCQCGSKGCLEQFLGRPAILRNCELEVGTSSNTIIEAHEQKNPTVLKGLAVAGEALGHALISLINIFDINNIVIGGQLSEIIDLLIPYTKRVMQKRLMSHHRPLPVFHIAKRGSLASAIGAAYMVLNQITKAPASVIA